jgi:hypothetical protein
MSRERVCPPKRDARTNIVDQGPDKLLVQRRRAREHHEAEMKCAGHD